MRSNDEFIKNVYKKRDEALKKRKKKITAAVSGLCVAVIAFAGATEVVPLLRHKSTSAVEEKPDIVDVNGNITAIADAEGTYYDAAYDESGEDGVMSEGEEIFYLTDVYTRPGFGYDGNYNEEMQTEIALEDDGKDSAEGAVTSSTTRVTYTDEQIADAAYSSLSPKEKEKVVSKTSYTAMVSYEVNVGESYEVWFDSTDGGYVKVKLSSPGLERMN